MRQRTMYNISFTLNAYNKIHDLKYVFVVVLGLIYPIIIIANGLIILVVCLERKLHMPMYLFICNMACINLYGGSAVAPFIITRFVTEDYQITWLSCLMQIYFIYVYANCDITNLTLMAYDRYISICHPLEYESKMTHTKVLVGIVFTWLFPLFRVTITLSLSADVKICGIIIEKVYCDNYSLVRLACSDVSYYNIYAGILIFLVVILPFFVIIYSYARIILICLNLSKGGRVKLFSTCAPHLMALFNFIVGSSFELLQSRFDLRHVPYIIRVILSLYFLVLSPLINPIIYGVRTQAIKEAIMRQLCPKFYQRQAVVRCVS